MNLVCAKFCVCTYHYSLASYDVEVALGSVKGKKEQLEHVKT